MFLLFLFSPSDTLGEKEVHVLISTKGRYALRVLLDLAEQDPERYVPLKETAERQDLSEQYLQQITKVLVEQGLLEGISGKGGGYKLTRGPEGYNVGEILTLMEGTLASVACLAPNAKPCPRDQICRTLPMWQEFDALVHDFFYGKTLADLME